MPEDPWQASQLFERIRAVCPSFIPVDDAAMPQWQDDSGPLYYMRGSTLAWHLAELVADGRMDLVVPVLNLIEEALPKADEYTSELLVVGVLEDLQNACLRSEGRARLLDIRAHLGTESKSAWDELMSFWYGPPEVARKNLPPGSVP